MWNFSTFPNLNVEKFEFFHIKRGKKTLTRIHQFLVFLHTLNRQSHTIYFLKNINEKSHTNYENLEKNMNMVDNIMKGMLKSNDKVAAMNGKRFLKHLCP